MFLNVTTFIDVIDEATNDELHFLHAAIINNEITLVD